MEDGPVDIDHIDFHAKSFKLIHDELKYVYDNSDSPGENHWFFIYRILQVTKSQAQIQFYPECYRRMITKLLPSWESVSNICYRKLINRIQFMNIFSLYLALIDEVDKVLKPHGTSSRLDTSSSLKDAVLHEIHELPLGYHPKLDPTIRFHIDQFLYKESQKFFNQHAEVVDEKLWEKTWLILANSDELENTDFDTFTNKCLENYRENRNFTDGLEPILKGVFVKQESNLNTDLDTVNWHDIQENRVKIIVSCYNQIKKLYEKSSYCLGPHSWSEQKIWKLLHSFTSKTQVKKQSLEMQFALIYVWDTFEKIITETNSKFVDCGVIHHFLDTRKSENAPEIAAVGLNQDKLPDLKGKAIESIKDNVKFLYLRESDGLYGECK